MVITHNAGFPKNKSGVGEKEGQGGGRDLSGFTRLRIKTQVAKPKKYTLGSLRD
jgi:hypothetical protein